MELVRYNFFLYLIALNLTDSALLSALWFRLYGLEIYK